MWRYSRLISIIDFKGEVRSLFYEKWQTSHNMRRWWPLPIPPCSLPSTLAHSAILLDPIGFLQSRRSKRGKWHFCTTSFGRGCVKTILWYRFNGKTRMRVELLGSYVGRIDFQETLMRVLFLAWEFSHSLGQERTFPTCNNCLICGNHSMFTRDRRKMFGLLFCYDRWD